MSRPTSLAFLDTLLSSDAERFQQTNWLKSPFLAALWHCEFEGVSRSFELNFNISLPSGRKLLDCSKLILPFKYWLTICTNTALSGKLGAAPASEYGTVSGVLTWIDYLLLNAEEFQLEQYSLTTITRDSFRGAIDKLSSDRKKAIALYEWESKVVEYIGTRLSEMDEDTFTKTLSEHPRLAILDENVINSLSDISRKDTLRMRAWLQSNGYYIASDTHRYSLDSRKLSEILYHNTLRGIATTKPKLALFNIGEFPLCRREYNAVPTTRKGDNKGGRSLSEQLYKKCFSHLRALHQHQIYVDCLPAISVIDLANEEAQFDRDGRFATVPPKVVFTALRESIEYQIAYGDALVDTYIRLVNRAHVLGCTVESLQPNDFSACLDTRLENLGIECWSFRNRQRNDLNQFLPQAAEGPLSLEDRCKGFQYCLKVFYGSTAVVVGTLMARRQGELLDLNAKNALDTTQTYLVFRNAKSSRMLNGLREVEARPIASIAASAIKSIKRIQAKLIEMGLLADYTGLFRIPSASQATRLLGNTSSGLNNQIDALCDFARLPLLDGLRYYLRQHQLRRFFCMLFFWHSSFEGLDTLRWFLGHHDLEHIYRYVTESTPGRVLNSVKAQHVAEHISSYENLSGLLQKRFGASQFALLNTSELERHIISLIEDGTVSVEPEFFKGTDGTDYKILVTVN